MSNRQTLKTIDRLTVAALENMTYEQLMAITGDADYSEFTNAELNAIKHGSASAELCQRFDAVGVST
jgi:hypothetical protein